MTYERITRANRLSKRGSKLVLHRRTKKEEFCAVLQSEMDEVSSRPASVESFNIETSKGKSGDFAERLEIFDALG